MKPAKFYNMGKPTPPKKSPNLSDREVELVRRLHEQEGWDCARIGRKLDKSRWTIFAIASYRRRR